MTDGSYDEHASARLVDEPPKRAGRNAFERDRARVLHSAALRRLAAKTQIHGPGVDDFVRNRLTHSLEVAQVGREVAKALGCDPDVVDTACLAHDLGHPPFGHNGEVALDVFAADCGGFEGNAQTLRVLTRLEAKVVGPTGEPVGLNLTRASLDAVSKYPWPRPSVPAAGPTPTVGAVVAAPPVKYGVYADDVAVFEWMRRGAPARTRCLEAQVMDFADDVAYSVHDVEDGIQAGEIDPAALLSASERPALYDMVRRAYLPTAGDEELAEALGRLLTLPVWPTDHDGTRTALARLKAMASQLIGRFCSGVEAATRSAYGPDRLARYDAELVVPPGVQLEIAVLKGMSARYVMFTPERSAALEVERALVAELAELVLAGAPGTLEPSLRDDWLGAADDAARRRVVVDQVASLTDPSARTWHARLSRTP